MWSIATLGEVAEKEKGSFVDGPFGSNLKTSDYVKKGVPIIRIQNVRPNRFLSKDIKYLSPEKAAELHRHNYRPGDLIITKLGDPCGVACIAPESAGEGIIVADVIRFRGDKKRIDHLFLSYFIKFR